jgi:hypothetical protein
VAKLVVRLLVTAGLCSNPDISQKFTMGDISKGVANTLLPAKNIYNEKYSRTNIGVMGEKHGYVHIFEAR